ncbi:hypothetical protein BC940DRAFT_305516 [Gongronella butleri]|nr:hypothetical protein BC940DRAFT_305516 [Gongronella butleri]
MDMAYSTSRHHTKQHARLSKYFYLVVAGVVLFLVMVNLSSSKAPSGLNKDDLDLDDLPDELDYHIDTIQWRLPGNWMQKGESTLDNSMLGDQFQPVTAVVYDKKNVDDETLFEYLDGLLAYPFFREIVVYQPLRTSLPVVDKNGQIIASRTHQTTSGTVMELTTRSSATIKLLLSRGHAIDEMKTLSRYTLCASLATHEACFFQDVSTAAQPPLDGLYLNYMRYPQLVHALVPAEHYVDVHRWRFLRYDLNMHTGYTDVAYGVLAAKWRCQHFLTQLGKSGLGKDRLDMADAYFGIWTNQYPWVLVYAGDNVLAKGADAADDDHASLTSDPHFTGSVRRVIYDAIRRLQRALQADTTDSPKDYIEREAAMPPVLQRDTKAIGRRALLSTNIPLTMQTPQGVPWHWKSHEFDATRYKNPKDWDQLFVDQLPQGTSSSSSALEPDAAELALISRQWTAYGYHLAVDGVHDSCWQTTANKDDYFGLITMGNRVPASLELITDTPIKPGMFAISVLHQSQWVECSVKATQATDKGVAWEVSCPGIDDDYIHAVRWTFKNDYYPKVMNVCGFVVNALSV